MVKIVKFEPKLPTLEAATMTVPNIIKKWNNGNHATKVEMLAGFDTEGLRITCWWNELPVAAQSFILKKYAPK